MTTDTPDAGGDRIGFEVVAGVGHLRLGDGTRHNALRTVDWLTIAERLGDHPRLAELTAIVVAGAGDAFCAGSDIEQWMTDDLDQVEASFAAMEQACTALENVPVPTIAVLRGTAAGAGCQLALACDLRLMATTAVIGMPILRLGILVPDPFAARLARLAGVERTAYLLFTGELIHGDLAQEWGLVTRCYPPEELTSAGTELLSRLRAQPAGAVRAAKASMRRISRPPHHQPASAGPAPAVDWPDFQRGIHRFIESRSAEPYRQARAG